MMPTLRQRTPLSSSRNLIGLSRRYWGKDLTKSENGDLKGEAINAAEKEVTRRKAMPKSKTLATTCAISLCFSEMKELFYVE
jgi:hypothetical protein